MSDTEKAATGSLVRVQNVDKVFKRGSEEVHVLGGLNLEIPEGEFLALMGPSGSGKSTFVGLLSRLFDPSVGSIIVDGVDIRKYKLESLRRNIGVVPQSPLLFKGSVRENLCIGIDDATDADIEEALESANALQFISPLPHNQ